LRPDEPIHAVEPMNIVQRPVELAHMGRISITDAVPDVGSARTQLMQDFREEIMQILV
jgi:hypothetical protein